MSRINILSPHVADLIAAGEVVERPASAVKELLENAFDAGAHTVVVELRGGGRESIRVTDDGCGMSPEDAGVCCLRHATSKLRDERGLEAIGTLGFRGEALAAISSVSRLTLATRERGAANGVRAALTGGEIDEITPVGCPEGTTVTVRDLFFNTPARLKFLGSDRSEGAACVQTALRSALGRPEISVRCIRDGEEQFFSPGDGRADSCVYALLGREAALGFLPAATENDGVGVTGYVSSPAHCRGNRSAQYFFCNGRPIRSRTLQTALEQAYKNAAMVGKFPACVLYITLPNGLVDVNVHPTKAEVKFSREKAVFDGVYYAALAALGGEDRLAAPGAPAPAAAPARPVPSGAAGSFSAAPKKDFFRSMTAGEFRAAAAREKSAPPAGAALPVRDSGVPYRAEAGRPPVPAAPRTPPEKKAPAPAPEQAVAAPEFRDEPVRFIGEALGVYILLEQGDKLILVDKHAAHERALFDRLRLDDKPLMPQELLAPETVRTDPEGARLVEENAEALTRLGFVLEPFGEDSFALRAVPAEIDAAQAAPLAEELIEKLREGRTLSARDVWERLAETVACKAAVRGGGASSPQELLALARTVLRGDVKYCPHGRPVCVVLTRNELDKRFGRIV